MALKRVNLGVLPQLPNEILEDIFLRLPVRTLVKQTAVCKLWNSLIKTSTFIHAHRNRNQHNHLLLTLARPAGKERRIEDVRYLFYLHCDKPPFEVYRGYYQHITHPFVAYNRLHATSPDKEKLDIREFDVMETCNGLVCLVAYSQYIAMIWNPCIRKVVTLPPTINTSSDEVYAILHGFGYDSRTNDYKVVRIVIYRAQSGRKTSYEIWSLAQPFWKALGNLPPVDDFCPGLRTIFLRGAVHWVHGCREDGIWNCPPYYTIVSFDMSDEVFGEITMPQVMMTKSFVTISRYRNSLAMLQWDHALDCSQQLDMWVMQEYGVVESWTKLLTVKLPASAFSIGRLGFRNSGETLIKYINTRVATCNFHVHQLLNPDSEDNADFQVRGGKFYQYVFMEPFVESLVLLDHPYAISTCN